MKLWFFFPLFLSLAACDGDLLSHRPKDRRMPDLPEVQARLAFTCAYEKSAIPPRDAKADQLYKHARWLRKNNLLKNDVTVYPKIERLIRIATAYDHDKANLELRQMIAKGQAASENAMTETLDLTDDLIKRGIPGGYYDMGHYLENGYGVKQDKDLALKYYRKAADLGSPEAQFTVAEWLAPIDIAPDIARQMRRCAAEQGHPDAGEALGINLQGNGRYSNSLEAFQLGAKAGSPGAASFLWHGFDGPPSSDPLYYLGQHKDEERVRRYKAIWSFLSDYSYLNPKVPEIDQIVPLPPAKLPPWDGKLQWLKEHEANVPPPLPSEVRIVEMARAKGLDPETGRPLTQKRSEASIEPKPALATTGIPLGTQYATGQICPQTGAWVCSRDDALGGSRRVFIAGETLPGIHVPHATSVIERLKGANDRRLVDTVWMLAEVPDTEQKI
jgi:uncharacterized protein